MPNVPPIPPSGFGRVRLLMVRDKKNVNSVIPDVPYWRNNCSRRVRRFLHEHASQEKDWRRKRHESPWYIYFTCSYPSCLTRGRHSFQLNRSSLILARNLLLEKPFHFCATWTPTSLQLFLERTTVAGTRQWRITSSRRAMLRVEKLFALWHLHLRGLVRGPARCIRRPPIMSTTMARPKGPPSMTQLFLRNCRTLCIQNSPLSIQPLCAVATMLRKYFNGRCFITIISI